jgi:hypothetical protein
MYVTVEESNPITYIQQVFWNSSFIVQSQRVLDAADGSGSERGR